MYRIYITTFVALLGLNLALFSQAKPIKTVNGLPKPGLFKAELTFLEGLNK